MIRKGLSLQFYYGTHPNSYSTVFTNGARNRDIVYYGNHQWVKFFVDWTVVQPNDPGTASASWAQLNSVFNGGYLDSVIRDANEDQRGVILTLVSNFPSWANGVPSNRTEVGSGKAARRRLPTTCGVNSRWGWFLGYLFARYRPGEPANPLGPSATGPRYFGNPLGSFVNAIEFVNEPNLLCWRNTGTSYAEDPVMGGNELIVRTAEMMATAEAYAYGYASAAVLGPSVHDVGAVPNDPNAMGFDEYTSRMLVLLTNFRPRCYVGWSMHTYNDASDSRDVGVALRANAVINRLKNQQWKGPSGDRYLWITESGYDIPQAQMQNVALAIATATGKTEQKLRVVNHYNAVAGVPEVYLTMNHQIHDIGGDKFNAGLWDGPEAPSGDPAQPVIGVPRDVAEPWMKLGAALTP